ncbi:DUF5317 domain-containing protein [Leptolinea tardivitalis]|uniref:DUF5317 domain-containing protein n=2 Tax=Leptolinea tardivitalis TaxID=229920 RepID=A0A0N8GKR4_9CHLR|nr:DUF5317 domain-containing protein [Leptolinea tardivitalis]KPL70426.1 hypothetical protein ADM99_14860 [Leptolinea tardivitalis]GAP22002.1 hypothetical protein LTAR_02220 [Leptolinea tardivitalis]
MESNRSDLLHMILLFAVILGLAATLLRARLTHRTLKISSLKWEWLVILSVIPQILAFYVPSTGKYLPESILPVLQILSMFGLLVFGVINFLTPGFKALSLGLACNFLVILSNGGWMPISVETLKHMMPAHPEEYWTIGERLGLTKDRILLPAETHFVWLSDRFTLPPGLPQNIAFSLGDIFISIGAFFLLWSLSRKEDEKEKT